MKNEYGETLDRNGYAPSVYKYAGEWCEICGRRDLPLVRHEVFHGPYREKSKRYGAWMRICTDCHDKVHRFPAYYKGIRAITRMEVMARYGWDAEKWREVFGKLE
jgi:hypothetical protein